MASTHIVQAGDHISSLAEKYGFVKYETIWNHPENAELKALRKNPNVLHPGDKVHIPDRELRTVDRAVDARHKFTREIQELNLRIVLNRVYNKPYANTPCTVVFGAEKTDLTSDGKAQIEHVIDRSLTDGRVAVKDRIVVGANAVPIDRDVVLKIGFLDPAEEVSGQIARLANLGYYRGPETPVDDAEFVSAVEEFQCEHELVVDGKCGHLTQAKLVSVHGC
jgi:hypothetical protein